MPCPRDGATLAPLTVGVTHLERCPTCRGVWGTRAAVEALAGVPIASRAAHLSLGALGAEDAPRCPGCEGALEPEETRAAPGHELLGCPRCASLWLDAETLSALRGKRPSSPPPPEDRVRELAAPALRPGPAPPATDADEGRPAHVEHPFFAPGPARELAALGTLLLVSWAFTSTTFGETVAIFLRIQFHELGHALVAWSTGRSALPLPFGWTSWSFERSWLLVSMELLFPALLAVHGVREKKPAAVLTAVAMGAVFAAGLATPLEASEEWLVAGGTIGEALLPALALLAFHAPLPERARWDFWRWPLTLAAILAFVSVVAHDAEIASGARPVPFGSFVTGRAGDGDLERLVNDYGWPEESLRPFFGALSRAALGLGLAPLVAILGGRWLLSRVGARADAPR
jgi:Zn-finger nucleic acid-binding protein